jgi:hypothetical protein
MLWQLLIKDLKRARHNPWPYVINLALPLCITALIGLVFGPSAKAAASVRSARRRGPGRFRVE